MGSPGAGKREHSRRDLVEVAEMRPEGACLEDKGQKLVSLPFADWWMLMKAMSSMPLKPNASSAEHGGLRMSKGLTA
jgi:hypothetical protein